MFSIESDTSDTESLEQVAREASKPNKKLILSVLLGAAVVVLVGVPLYFRATATGSAGGTGAIGTTGGVQPPQTTTNQAIVNPDPNSQPPPQADPNATKVSKPQPLQVMISRVKENLPLTIVVLVGLAVIVAVAISLAVYFSTENQSVFDNVLPVKADDVIVEPEPQALESVPVWQIVVLVLVGLIVVVGGGFAIKSGVEYLSGAANATTNTTTTPPAAPPAAPLGEAEGAEGKEPDPEPEIDPATTEPDPVPAKIEGEMAKLNEERNKNVEDPLCVFQNPTFAQKQNYLQVDVQNPPKNHKITVYCATDYTPNSIWRAIMKDNAKKMANKSLVFVPDGNMYKLVVPTSLGQITMQSAKGTLGKKPVPKTKKKGKKMKKDPEGNEADS